MKGFLIGFFLGLLASLLEYLLVKAIVRSRYRKSMRGPGPRYELTEQEKTEGGAEEYLIEK